MTLMVEVHDLGKTFNDIVAVDSLSFDCRRGEVLGILGPNGAGKSTTMKMITGFLSPDHGKAVIDGFDVVEQSVAAKRKIGYLPEGAPLYGDMTAGRFLDFIARIRGYRGAEAKDRVAATVAVVNLESVLDQPIETLSKGFKRRVGLAQAILHDPDLLILDEPTDGLDPNQKHEVRKLIRDMASQKAIILSTHILEEVDAVCDRALIIAKGRIVADGTPGELESRSKYHNAVYLKVENAEAGPVAASFNRLPDVSEVVVVSEGDNQVCLRVFPQSGKSIVQSVADAAKESGYQVDELYAEKGRLDEVFRSVTLDGQVAEQPPC